MLTSTKRVVGLNAWARLPCGDGSCVVKNPFMRRLSPSAMSLLAVAILVSACAEVPVQRPASQAIPSQPGDRQILAGEWEYEDGAVVTLTLDAQGNGPYPWKGGRFETYRLDGHAWEGMWIQQENDREGGFSVELSSDFSEGDGRWWYTRIGNDHSPTQKGGTFHLMRKASHAKESDTPPAP